MKKRFFVILIIVFGLIFFTPVSLTGSMENSRVDYICYNANFGSDEADMEAIKFLTPSDYDEAEVLKCLSRYKEYRTIFRAGDFFLNDMELEISLTVNGESKTILLGNINYMTKSYGAPKHGIYHADALRNELLDILNVSNTEGKSST